MTTGITISFGPATARSRHITNRMPRRARAGDGLAAALKRVVKSVETTLGAVITEAEGQDLFDVVEAVRLDFVPSREGSGTNPASHQHPPDAVLRELPLRRRGGREHRGGLQHPHVKVKWDRHSYA